MPSPKHLNDAQSLPGITTWTADASAFAEEEFGVTMVFADVEQPSSLGKKSAFGTVWNEF